MRRALALLGNLLRLLMTLMFMGISSLAHAWKENTDGDMPWLGGGGRAHYYSEERSAPFTGTGYRRVNRWGRSTWSGEDPYATAGRVMGFLDSIGALAAAPAGQGAGSVATESGQVVQPRAFPYRFTIVMLEPTVVVMNFDLVALTRGNEEAKGQVLGSPMLNGWMRYGTRVPATGTLLWFSPEGKQAPVAVAGQASGRGEIVVKGTKLVLEKQGDTWVVTRP